MVQKLKDVKELNMPKEKKGKDKVKLLEMMGPAKGTAWTVRPGS